jgi:hypothetical protein
MMVHFVRILRWFTVYPMCTAHPPPRIFIPPPMDGDADDALKKIEMSHSLINLQLDLCSIIIE